MVLITMLLVKGDESSESGDKAADVYAGTGKDICPPPRLDEGMLPT
jgi:hypothetical protein